MDYPGGFYREQAPVYLNYICALNDVQGPNLSGPFTYCEIGCGTGETTASLAACHPSGAFFGIDLSTSHIEQAAALADKGELKNTQFIAADITEIESDSLPDFDFITLHGLYSWVPTPVQVAIRRFLASKLKPGGIAYVSYNAMPGWGSVSPLRRFFVDQSRHLQGDPIAKAEQIVAALLDLREKHAPFFRENPAAADVLSRLTAADRRYIAHEYLSSSWQPRYFADVYKEMTQSGLRYIGEGGIVENLLEHSVAPTFVETLKNEPDPCRRETLRDFIQNRFFRRDIYIKPDPRNPSTAYDEPLKKTLFGLIADPIQFPETINIADAPAVQLSGAWLERVKKLLGYRVLTLAEILNDAELQTFSEEQLVEGIKLLSVGGFCTPCATRETEPPRGPAESIRVVPKLNQARLEQHDWSESGFVLVSPVLGAGITLNSLETALLLGVQHPEPLEWAWSEIKRKGVTIQSVGDKMPIEHDHEAKRALKDALDQFLKYKLPKLAYLGVVEPA